MSYTINEIHTYITHILHLYFLLLHGKEAFFSQSDISILDIKGLHGGDRAFRSFFKITVTFYEL